MTFNDFYQLSDNLPFSVAITIVTILSLIEGIAFMIGTGLLSFIDSLLPNFDLNIDGPNLEDQGLVSKTLTFLKVKNVPLIILLITFLMSFGVSGLLMQSLVLEILGFTVSALILIIPATIIGLGIMKAFGEVLAKVMPKDETDAEKIEAFVGKVGVLTLGTAEKDKPAQCKVKDKKGHLHYFMALTDNDEKIHMGQKVILVRYEEPYFYIIKNENKHL